MVLANSYGTALITFVGSDYFFPLSVKWVLMCGARDSTYCYHFPSINGAKKIKIG